MNVDYFKSALLHHSKGNWNKAKEIYEHILKSNPNNYSVLQNYGPLLSHDLLLYHLLHLHYVIAGTTLFLFS